MALGNRQLGRFYHQLAQPLAAGLPLPAALRLATRTGAPAAALEAMAKKIETGGSFDDALGLAASWLPASDRLALSAAAATGGLPRILQQLSARHAQLGAARLRVLLACAYPTALLHAGLLLLPVARMINWEKGFEWSLPAYLQTLALSLGSLWFIVSIFWILIRRKNRALRRVILRLPAVGAYLRAQSLADFSFALATYLEAGVPIGPAWRTAGSVASSAELQAAAIAAEQLVNRGIAPGSNLPAWACFPPDFVGIYQTGEATGQLEASLHRWSAQSQETAHRALNFATVLYPAGIFLIIGGSVVYYIVTLYAGYLKMLVDLTR